MIKISLIIPFYNVDAYISRCLDSVFDQDLPFSQYEVICVNDKSTDDSRALVVRYKDKYDNLMLIDHKENQKQGSARNTGLSVATGKYVWFIDSDDYIESNILSTLINVANDKCVDMLLFDYNRVLNNRIESYRIQYDDKHVYSGQDFFLDTTYETWWQRCIEVWRKIYRCDFLKNNALRFADNVMYEDTDFSIKTFMKANRVAHYNKSVYYYRRNEESVTQRKKTPQILLYQLFLAKRCDDLIGFSDSFDTIIVDLIKYQLQDIKNSLRTFSIDQKKEYRKMISVSGNTNFVNKYCTLKNSLYLKYPNLFL